MRYKTIRRRLIDAIIHSDRRKIDIILKPFYKFSTLLFAIATVYYILLFIHLSIPFYYMIRSVALVLIILIYGLYNARYINVHFAIICNSICITVLVFLTLGYEIINRVDNTPKHILIEMSIFLVPMVMATLTIYRKISLIMSFCILLLYSYSAFALNDLSLKTGIPIYFIILLGVWYMLVHTLKIINNFKTENQKLTSEQQALLNFFNLSRAQWKLIKEGNLSKDEAEKILNEMELDTRHKLISSLKETIYREDCIKKILLSYHPTLTHSEVDVAIHIIQGKSVSEIAKIRHTTNSGVTLTRSRIRKKIGLKHTESLNLYLETLIGDNIDDY